MAIGRHAIILKFVEGVKRMLKHMADQAVKIHRDQRGQGMAEYGLIIALVAVLAIAGFRLLGRNLGSKVQDVADTIQNPN